VSTYRSRHADHGDWHEIVGESGEQGEGCLMAAVKAAGWAALAGVTVAATIMLSAWAAFNLDLW
jgi:hypothetical protein